MNKNLANGELSLMKIIWDNSPVKSGEVVAIAGETLGWKKSTVYTVVKKLTLKGYIKSENAVITAVKSREEVMHNRSEELIERSFGGSLPMFLTAFLQKERLTREEAEELKKLIDEYTEEK
ncbi:MAG: BlaI/MecI/CopY family transcriptional regulator [Ruminococcus sp.]|nr:BlaI/MecI/CopY family transcriptional regulator [Ruminococcus sp.]